MASVFRRLFRIGQAETHAVLNSLEDPIKMTEQGIRDLKRDLHASMTSLAEVKGIAIRLKKDADESKSLAAEYERKAMLLLQRMEKGDLALPWRKTLRSFFPSARNRSDGGYYG